MRNVLFSFALRKWGDEVTCPAPELGSNPGPVVQVIASSCVLSALVRRHVWILHSRIIYRRHGCLSSDCILKGSWAYAEIKFLSQHRVPNYPWKTPGPLPGMARFLPMLVHICCPCICPLMDLCVFLRFVYYGHPFSLSRGSIPRKGIVFWWGHCSVTTGLSRWNSFSLLSCHVYSVEFKEVKFKEVVSLL